MFVSKINFEQFQIVYERQSLKFKPFFDKNANFSDFLTHFRSFRHQNPEFQSFFRYFWPQNAQNQLPTENFLIFQNFSVISQNFWSLFVVLVSNFASFRIFSPFLTQKSAFFTCFWLISDHFDVKIHDFSLFPINLTLKSHFQPWI